MFRSAPILLAAFLGLSIAIASLRFLALGLVPAFPQMLDHIAYARLAFVAHISAAPVALALGAFQFMPGLRQRAPALHRWSGRVYAGAILIAGVGALGMTATDNGGPLAQVGFGLLAVLWIGFTAVAVRHAMARRIELHRRWMTRSYALTFAAVTLRLYLVPMMGAGMSYEEAIGLLAWLCWVPNLVFAEALLARRVRARA